jgi:hypothetical protein
MKHGVPMNYKRLHFGKRRYSRHSVELVMSRYINACSASGSTASCSFHAWLTLDGEDGGDMLLRNVSWLSPATLY